MEKQAQTGETTFSFEQQGVAPRERLLEIKNELWGISKNSSNEQRSQLIDRIPSALIFMGETLKQDNYYLETLKIINYMGTASSVADIPELNQLRNSFVEQNLQVIMQGAIEEGIKSDGDDKNRRVALRCLSFTVVSGTEKQRTHILSTIDSHRFDLIHSPGDTEVFRSYFEVIFKHGSVEQKKNAAELVLSFYNNNEDFSRKVAGLNMMRLYYDQFSDKSFPASDIIQLDDPIYQQITETLKQYIPDIDDLVQKVLYGGPVSKNIFGNPDNVGTRLVDNMNAVLHLERQRSGICQVLRKEFGIRNFFRYPPEVLIAQYDNRNVVTEIGIVAVALYDHNGYFYQGFVQNKVLNLFARLQNEQTLGKKYGLMVYEIEDSRELARAITHSQSRKLLFGMIIGYGALWPKSSVELDDFFSL